MRELSFWGRAGCFFERARAGALLSPSLSAPFLHPLTTSARPPVMTIVNKALSMFRPTARDSMLAPRRAKTPATRLMMPASSATKAEITCLAAPPGRGSGGAYTSGVAVVVAGAEASAGEGVGAARAAAARRGAAAWGGRGRGGGGGGGRAAAAAALPRAVGGGGGMARQGGTWSVFSLHHHGEDPVCAPSARGRRPGPGTRGRGAGGGGEREGGRHRRWTAARRAARFFLCPAPAPHSCLPLPFSVQRSPAMGVEGTGMGECGSVDNSLSHTRDAGLKGGGLGPAERKVSLSRLHARQQSATGPARPLGSSFSFSFSFHLSFFSPF